MILTSLGLGLTRLNPTIGSVGPVTSSPLLIYQEEEPAKLYFIQGDEFPIVFFIRKD